MPQDLHGLALTAASDAAAAALDHAELGYLKYRADAADRLKAALVADPKMPMAHVLRGTFAMLSYKAANLDFAAQCLAAAETLHANPRERAHMVALKKWIANDVPGATRAWADILKEYPRDILAFRLHHFAAFWAGRPGDMAASAEATAPHFTEDDPGHGSVLACRCFALEECGEYLRAEAYGREAVAIDPADMWAAHAVAHILEMQGRHAEGIAWLTTLEPNWEGGNNLKHHLFWHRALYHFERAEFDQVLALYDRGFRDLASPLTQAMPDLYIDIQNAASTLLRLELRGIAVGTRWKELADHAEARIGDHLSAFTLPHWMMALAADGRFEAAQRMLEAMARDAAGNTAHARLLREVALPVCRAVLAHRQGDHAQAVAHMRAVLPDMPRLGGSHAQQDVLEQLFLDAAVSAGLADDAALLLDRVRARHPLPPARRTGYRHALAEGT
jgi:tetratricopeptide (TPR) repeat protein